MDQFIYNSINPLPMLAIIGVLLITIFALGKGADILVDQAIKLSRHWNIPELVIAATIVSLGTTLPESTVSISASFLGNPGIALGNAVGSMICNTTFILGLALMIKGTKFNLKGIKFNLYVLIFVSFLIVLISIPFLNLSEFSRSLIGHINFLWGFFLLAILVTFLYLNSKNKHSDEEDEELYKKDIKLPIVFLLLLVAIAIIFLSSKIILPSAIIIAKRMSIPDSIIGATLIALGTSLPELSTAISSARKGKTSIALGNVIGANILNIVFVIGGSLAVNTKGISVSSDFFKLTYPTLLILFTIFPLMIFLNRKRYLSRIHGFILFCIYIVYIILSYSMI